MKVLVLGCGPAGLLAAHAAKTEGAEVIVASRKVKSPLSGAVYVHEPIEGLTRDRPEREVEFRTRGTREGYAEKVYGDPAHETSWDLFAQKEVPAWSMAKVYDKLWDRWEAVINDVRVGPFSVGSLYDAADVVISTIPAPALCLNPGFHRFKSARVILTDQARNSVGEDEVIYNGDPKDPWYRSSRLFGIEATEYPARDETERVVMRQKRHWNYGLKPQSTTCDCHSRIHRVGRFGRWERGVLVHHAFAQTQEIIRASA